MQGHKNKPDENHCKENQKGGGKDTILQEMDPENKRAG